MDFYMFQVIVATNIAETSITIDDIVYVVDCGKHKENHYNPNKVCAFLNFYYDLSNVDAEGFENMPLLGTISAISNCTWPYPVHLMLFEHVLIMLLVNSCLIWINLIELQMCLDMTK